MRHERARAGSPGNGLSRREFGRLVGALSALGCLEPHWVARALGATPKRLSFMAYRTAGAEGVWPLRDIEGAVPKDLHGTLYRIAPGQKDNHGTILRHLFDGDAFVSGFSLRDGSVTLRARFVATPERQRELEAGRMLYAEFGTLPPPPPAGAPPSGGEPGGRVLFKNQPNVNVIQWDGRLLGLSEGGHPTAIDPRDFSYQGRWDFHRTLPAFVPFTAHPKFDPATGEGFGYGVAQGPGLNLTVFRMVPDGTLQQIWAVSQPGYVMVHDMLMSQQHLVFVIPPVHFDLAKLFSGQAAVADALHYFEDQPTRLLVLRRDGSGAPTTFELPPSMVFHHGNAFEREGKLLVDTILSPDGGVLDLLFSFSAEVLPEVPPPRLVRLELDLAAGVVAGRSELAIGQEFPRFDIRQSGRDARFLYSMATGTGEDPLVATALVRHDLHRGASQSVEAGRGRALGESVFVPRAGAATENEGWLLLQGYDASRDENFLEVRDAGTLDFAARVWTGQHLPLGFHGNFVPGQFVEPT